MTIHPFNNRIVRSKVVQRLRICNEHSLGLVRLHDMEVENFFDLHWSVRQRRERFWTDPTKNLADLPRGSNLKGSPKAVSIAHFHVLQETKPTRIHGIIQCVVNNLSKGGIAEPYKSWYRSLVLSRVQRSENRQVLVKKPPSLGVVFEEDMQLRTELRSEMLRLGKKGGIGMDRVRGDHNICFFVAMSSVMNPCCCELRVD